MSVALRPTASQEIFKIPRRFGKILARFSARFAMSYLEAARSGSTNDKVTNDMH
jgi:hypothetical protein